MGFCTECGKAVGNSSKFCGDCGARLGPGSKDQSSKTMYTRTSLKIDPTVSADYFVLKVKEILNQEAERVPDLKEIYGENWQSVFAAHSSHFPMLSPSTEVLSILKSDATSLKSLDLSLLVEVHNYSVLALRHICDQDVRKMEKVKVREGLIIPRDWQVHYENLLQSESPLLVLAVMQHVFTGNPLAGELYEWDNQKGGLFGGNSRNVGRTIIGASVIGAAAALLLGG